MKKSDVVRDELCAKLCNRIEGHAWDDDFRFAQKTIPLLQEIFDAGLAYERKRSAAVVEALKKSKKRLEFMSKPPYNFESDITLEAIETALKQYEAEGES